MHIGARQSLVTELQTQTSNGATLVGSVNEAGQAQTQAGAMERRSAPQEAGSPCAAAAPCRHPGL